MLLINSAFSRLNPLSGLKMKCSKCQFENPEGAKFCVECGTPMEFRYPKCEAEVYLKEAKEALESLG